MRGTSSVVEGLRGKACVFPVVFPIASHMQVFPPPFFFRILRLYWDNYFIQDVMRFFRVQKGLFRVVVVCVFREVT